jgi:hypothetical protein
MLAIPCTTAIKKAKRLQLVVHPKALDIHEPLQMLLMSLLLLLLSMLLLLLTCAPCPVSLPPW